MNFHGEPERVTGVDSRTADHVREIWYRSADGAMRRLETTDGHPFWVEERGWVAARSIQVRDNLTMLHEETAVVVRNERFERPERVYNLDVEKSSSYFAGGVLVHQNCGLSMKDPRKRGSLKPPRVSKFPQEVPEKGGDQR